MVTKTTYAGTHTVKTNAGPIEREIPPIVDSDLRHSAFTRLEENKRYSGGKRSSSVVLRTYLLRGLLYCEHCGTAYVGASKTNASKKRYYYYNCRGRLGAYQDKRKTEPGCPGVQARWLEELVWVDCRRFLHDPGEVLERVKDQQAGGQRSEDLEERHASLTKRLAAKQAQKDRYVKLYAAGHLDEEELDTYLQDLRNQIENLKLLAEAVQADLAREEQDKEVATTTEAWLVSLRENLDAVEADTDEAFAKRRELVKLLVERMVARRGEDGGLKVDITCRFGPPTGGDTGMCVR
jgi:site-specific DNA recombinase